MHVPDAAPEIAVRVVALDALYAKLTNTKRNRSPVEASPVHTGAYVSLQFAYGYARLGRADLAHALTADARLALAARDRVHAWLVDAFEARIGQAIAGLPAETPLSSELALRLRELDRVTRYKVDRLREVSAILNFTRAIDPIGTFARRTGSHEFESLTSTERAYELAELVELAATTAVADERIGSLVGVFDATFGLSEVEATPLMIRANAIVATATPKARAMLYTRALLAASYFERTDLFADLLVGLRSAIPDAISDLAWVTHHAVRVLRRFGMRREIAGLVVDLERVDADLEHAASEQARLATELARASTLALVGQIGMRRETGDLVAEVDHAETAKIERMPLAARVARAGALAFLGETARAASIFDAADALFQRPMTTPGKLELTRALAQAYAQMPIEDRLRKIDGLASAFVHITDGFGTNSHYAISALDFVESLVLGLSD